MPARGCWCTQKVIAQDQASAATDARDARTPFLFFYCATNGMKSLDRTMAKGFFSIRSLLSGSETLGFSAIRVQQLHLSMNLFLLSKQQQRTEG